MKKIFLDLETTGLNIASGDRVIEICCLKIDKYGNEKFFHSYLNPETNVKRDAFFIHGIDDKFLNDKPFFKDIVFDFLDYIRNSKIIIHNAKFDLKFLNFELKILNLNKINKYCYKIIDTLKLSKKIYTKGKHSLKNLCKKFNIDDSKRIKHDALTDTKLLYKVYLKLLEKINIIKIKKCNKKKREKFLNINYNNIIKKANLKENVLNNFLLNILNI